TEPRQLGVDVAEAARGRAQLFGRGRRAAPVQAPGELRDPSLEPLRLRLELERARVAVGQRVLEAGAVTRSFLVGRLLEPRMDVVVETGGFVGHRAAPGGLDGYVTAGPSGAWAQRPILAEAPTHPP